MPWHVSFEIMQMTDRQLTNQQTKQCNIYLLNEDNWLTIQTSQNYSENTVKPKFHYADFLSSKLLRRESRGHRSWKLRIQTTL